MNKIFFSLICSTLLMLSSAPMGRAQDSGEDASSSDAAEQDKKRESSEDDSSEDIGAAMSGAEDPITKLLDEVQDNMKSIEELLNQKNTGSSTQEAANKALKTMDELIEEIQKQASQSQSSSSSQSRNQRRQQSQDQKQSRKQQKLEREKQKQGQKDEPKDNSEVPNDQTSEGKMPPSEDGELNSRRGGGVWGQLQKRDVEQVFDNGRNAMPEKYRILLEEYYGGGAQSTTKSQ